MIEHFVSDRANKTKFGPYAVLALIKIFDGLILDGGGDIVHHARLRAAVLAREVVAHRAADSTPAVPQTHRFVERKVCAALLAHRGLATRTLHPPTTP